MPNENAPGTGAEHGGDLHFFSGTWFSNADNEGYVLGSGSFGKVYRAWNSQGQYAAIKVISIPASESELNSARGRGLSENDVTSYFWGVVNNWENEIHLQKKLQSCPNVVAVQQHEVVPKQGRFGWNIHIRMELLTSFVSYSEAYILPENCVLTMGMELCDALQACHEAGIIHRDIKPENIFISPEKVFKLGDFGVARQLNRTSSNMTIAGTVNYMAPEVYLNRPYGKTADIYSLGLVLYGSLNNNRQPFLPPSSQAFAPQNETTALLTRMGGTALPPPAAAGSEAAAVILKACAFDAAQRWQTPAEFKVALEKVYHSQLQMDRPSTVQVLNQAATIHLLKNEGARFSAQNPALAVLPGANPCPPPPMPVLRSPPPAAAPVHRAPPKRKSRAGAIIASILLLAGALAVALIVVPRLTGRSLDLPFFRKWSEWATRESQSAAPVGAQDMQEKQQFRSRSVERQTFEGAAPEGWQLESAESETWGEWSEWNSQSPAQQPGRQVEDSTLYRSRPISYQLATNEWSEWSTTPYAAGATREVEQKYQYRARMIEGVFDANYVLITETNSTEWGPWRDEIYVETGVLVPQGDGTYAGTKGLNEERVVYRYRDTTPVPVYGEWSSWGESPVLASDTLDVEQQAAYRYRQALSPLVCHCVRYGAWSEWADSEPAKSDTLEVESRTVYRYLLE